MFPPAAGSEVLAGPGEERAPAILLLPVKYLQGPGTSISGCLTWLIHMCLGGKETQSPLTLDQTSRHGQRDHGTYIRLGQGTQDPGVSRLCYLTGLLGCFPAAKICLYC